MEPTTALLAGIGMLQIWLTVWLVRYGLHRQEAAVVTCITPSPLRADHLHFVDGAGGGYARAAQNLKRAVG